MDLTVVAEHDLITAYMCSAWQGKPCLVIYNPWESETFNALSATGFVTDAQWGTLPYGGLLIRPLDTVEEGEEICNTYHAHANVYMQVWDGSMFMYENT